MTSGVDLPGIDVLLPMVEATGQRQTGPAALDGFEQAEHDDVLRPRVGRLVHLSGMIEEEAAAKDPLSSFVVDAVVESQHQAPIDQGGRDQAPGNGPEAIPGQMGRGHEDIEAAGIHVQTEQGLQGAQQIGAHRGGKGDDDRQQGEDEPVGAFATQSRVGKVRLERGE